MITNSKVALVDLPADPLLTIHLEVLIVDAAQTRPVHVRNAIQSWTARLPDGRASIVYVKAAELPGGTLNMDVPLEERERILDHIRSGRPGR